MADTNVPNNDSSSTRKQESAAKRRKQKSYQESLSYERAFLKKKQELSRSETMKQLQQDIKAIQDRAAVDLALARDLFDDRAVLEKQLAKIKSQLASDLAQKQLELVSEQRKNEYAAHEFAAACAMKSFQTQNVHQRAQTAAALADAQRIQVEKLKAIKSAQIAELQAQRESASSEEKKKINSEIRKLKREIANAESQEVKYQEQAVEYAQIVKRVDFERLSAADKLAEKQRELADLRAEADKAVAEIDSKIEAKKIDLAAAESSGNNSLAERLQQEIAGLQESLATTEKSYQESVKSLTDSIERSGGYRDQAISDSGTRVTQIFVPAKQSDDTDESVTEVNKFDIAAQIDLILNSLTNFVTAFEKYVDTLDSKITTGQALESAAILASVQQANSSKDNSTNLLSYLRTLVDQSASEDIDLQTQLNAKIDRLGDVLSEHSDIDLSAIIKPLELDSSTDAVSSIESLMEDMLNRVSDRDEKSDKSNENLTAKQKAQKIIDDEAEARRAKAEEAAVTKEEMKLRFKNAFTKEGATDLATRFATTQLLNAVQGLQDICNKIDTNVKEYFQYQAEINARLQGTDLTYKDMISTMNKNLGMSTLVRQQDYINKFKELVDAGIMHNMETRAFLATVTDKVVNTFDAFDSNLLRLVRLQQNDSTAARMGLESSLNKLFNSYFSDSSYLSSSGPHDSISAAILEASSMLSNDMSLEFEYMVHKWLGSLYSLGMSSDTLEQIAQGLNYLGTGNVAALTGNDSLQTLLAMSAVHGGVSYADLLTQGLNADSTNKLLSGMVEYLMQIAKNTESTQVTKSAYSDLFGLHMSDLRAITNLTDQDISSLTNLKTTYSQSVNETQNQLNSIASRTHLSTMIENLFDNAVLGASLDIGNTPAAYGLWKTLNLVEGMTGGIALPFINIFGSGLDLNTTVTQLAKGGMAGLALLGNLIQSLGSGGFAGGMNLKSNWHSVEMTSRGSASKFLASGVDSGFSTSTRIDSVGSGSSEDIKRTEMSDASDSAEKDSEITNKNVQEEQDIPTQIYAQTQAIWSALANEDNTLLEETVEIHKTLKEKLKDISVLSSIGSLLAPSRVFFTSETSDLDLSSGSVIVDNYESKVSRLQNVTSVLNDVFNSSSSLSSSNVDIWSLINYTSDLTSKKELERGLAEQNITDSTLVSNLVKSINTSTNKTQVIEDLKQMAEIQTLNRVVFPEYVRANIDDMSPAVKKYVEDLLKKIIESSFGGSLDSTEIDPAFEDEYSHPMIRQLKHMLTDPTTVVTVKQDTFY